uniref:Uncharacterized protein n=1 Tax=Podoviridae sp. ctsUe5 TaxID=2827750 RepID=A0A8S5S6P6_9CAUD|nr:MAG TPA: hypothetical protein [Podoviridae sp. ctsUe5]
MYNFNTYSNTQCRTCIWLCTGTGSTQCDKANNCIVCDNYNHEQARCKCREKATDETECPYYKENKDARSKDA